MHFLNSVVLFWRAPSIFSCTVFTEEINQICILRLLHQAFYQEFYGQLGMVSPFISSHGYFVVITTTGPLLRIC